MLGRWCLQLADRLCVRASWHQGHLAGHDRTTCLHRLSRNGATAPCAELR
ncbi:MAG: DUF995 domain-containing protein [Oxalobacteraceae bacterium]|nr:DUF995 domain-containing protein [Oxalobacteraceae bacterium]